MAELGAAFVLAEVGVARTPHPDHAAYTASWLPLLRADPHALGVAAAQASRAASYLAALAPPASSAVMADRPEAAISADPAPVSAEERRVFARRRAA